MNKLPARIILTFLLALCVLPLSGARADLLERSAKLISSGNYPEAQQTLEKSLEDDSYNAKSYLLKVIVENRLGNYEDAIDAGLTAQRELNYKNPKLDLELGWAYVKLNRYQDAVRHLTSSLAANPHSPKGRELLARAHLLNGDAQKAKAEFETVRSQDPTLITSYNIDVFNYAPSIQQESNWNLWATTDFGFNDNVIGLGNDQALPSDISDEEAWYAGVHANVGYKTELSDKDSASINYQVSARLYEDLSDFNSQFHRLRTNYERRLADKLGIALALEGNDYLLDNDQFRKQFIAQPGLFYRWNQEQRTILNYIYANSDYSNAPVIPSLSRDSHSNGMNLSHELGLPNSRLTLGFSLLGNEAQGAEFDYSSYGFQGSYIYWLPECKELLDGRAIVQLSAAFHSDDYDTASSFGGNAAREDDVSQYGVSIHVPIVDELYFYVSYNRRRNVSNVAVYDYTQNEESVGLTKRF